MCRLAVRYVVRDEKSLLAFAQLLSSGPSGEISQLWLLLLVRPNHTCERCDVEFLGVEENERLDNFVLQIMW